MLRPILSNEFVRLARNLPELSLQSGTVGVVRSAWFYPRTAYEVEFVGRAEAHRSRVLLLEDEVVPVDGVPGYASCDCATAFRGW